MAKISDTQLSNKIREKISAELLAQFIDNGEDAKRTASNQFAFPVVDEADNEKWVVITVTVPKGSRDGEAYDGYAMAEEYEMKTKEKEEKRKRKHFYKIKEHICSMLID